MEVLTTNGITVSVQTQYLPAHSNPRAGKLIFGYHIAIENGSPHTVQLLRRHWVIQEASGELRDILKECGALLRVVGVFRHDIALFCFVLWWH